MENTVRQLAAAFFLIPMVIVRRADVPDQKYLALGAGFPAVVTVGRAGDATLISDRWLITAAHVAQSLPAATTVRVGARNYAVDRVVIHPSWQDRSRHDIALLRLAQVVTGVKPIPVYRGSAEQGLVATFVGHGAAGSGTNRTRIDDGRRRAATSRVDSANAAWLYFSFDAPPHGTRLEGAPGRGDSGGPAVIAIRGGMTVAGVSSAGFDGRNGPGSYGAIDAFTRVSTHVAWIDSVMASSATSAPRRQTSRAKGNDNQAMPNTALGRRFAAFVEAVEANTDASMRIFVRDNFEAREIAARPALVPNLRRLSALLQNAAMDRVVSSSETALAVRFSASTGPVTIELVAEPSAAKRLVDWRRYE